MPDRNEQTNQAERAALKQHRKVLFDGHWVSVRTFNAIKAQGVFDSAEQLNKEPLTEIARWRRLGKKGLAEIAAIRGATSTKPFNPQYAATCVKYLVDAGYTVIPPTRANPVA